jgi:hypothetical protein
VKSKVLMNPVDTLPSSQLACKICGAASRLFDEAIVLRKHTARYFRCVECGFLQTEEPHWIDEAYSSAIAGQDVGIMARNLTNGHVASAVLNLLFPQVSEAVDFGAGHGIFVRLMRDRGFNFLWSDRYATNDYARGFEAPAGKRFDFLTAFEVLEHLPDPISDVSRLMELSDNVFVSTALVPSPPPRINEWWYYMPGSGQHISFYTKESLQSLAARFHRHLLSFNSYHLFSSKPHSRFLFQLAVRPRAARILNSAFRRPSLIPGDLEKMTS